MQDYFVYHTKSVVPIKVNADLFEVKNEMLYFKQMTYQGEGIVIALFKLWDYVLPNREEPL